MKPSILNYFKLEWKVLLVVTITGLIYNLGLLLGPYYEGKLTQGLYDVFSKNISYTTLVHLVLLYVISIFIVQFARFLKRNYVRVFANNTNKRFKNTIYRNILTSSLADIHKEGTGTLLTKAISDADDCSEGIRKFTTEIFDTFVALCAYLAMLLYYDYKLTFLCILFVPLSYFLAEKMKTIVHKTSTHFKQVTASLNDATLDRVNNALLYRVYGREEAQKKAYETILTNYEHASNHSNIPLVAFPPLYQLISLLGIFSILYFGSRNVLQGTWSIASFTTFISCFIKLSIKSSKSAKLFNAVQKAQVSWKRVVPYLQEKELPTTSYVPIEEVKVEDISFHYPNGPTILQNISFELHKGEILGITGPIASGKSTLGKLFLDIYPYEGKISISSNCVTYLGHDFQLFNDTIFNNISLGEKIDVESYLKLVCLDSEVQHMEQGMYTKLGNDGVRLSKGQAQRIALARVLAHARSLIILDDPFSALDTDVEKKIFNNIQLQCKDKMILLISHRLTTFSSCDKVLLLKNGKSILSTHQHLLQTDSFYKELVHTQLGENYEA